MRDKKQIQEKRIQVPTSFKENEKEKIITKATGERHSSSIPVKSSILQNVLGAFTGTANSNKTLPQKHFQLKRISTPPSADSLLNTNQSLINSPQLESLRIQSELAGKSSQPISSLFQQSLPSLPSQTQHLAHFSQGACEFKKGQGTFEKSEKSAFSYVSPSKHAAWQNLKTPTISQTVTCSLRLRPRVSFSTCSSSTKESLFYSQNNSVRTNYPSENTITKTTVTTPRPVASQRVEYIESVRHQSTCNTESYPQCSESTSAATFFSPIQEENFSSSLLLPNTVNTVVVSNQNSAPVSSLSQTFLVTVPDKINVNQFSNQTLNLDYNSQQILKALLQQSTVSSSQPPHKKVEQSGMTLIADNDEQQSADMMLLPLKGETFASLLEDSNEEDKSEDNNTTKSNVQKLPRVTLSEQMSSPIIDFNIPKSLSNAKLQSHSEESTSNATSLNQYTVGDNASLVNKPPEQTGEKLNDPMLSSSNRQPQNEGQQNDGANPLPVAAINVNMINGQPVYTIQLMGQSIPLAAITIPTSEGPLQLQSATTALASSQISQIAQSSGLPENIMNQEPVSQSFQTLDETRLTPSASSSPSTVPPVVEKDAAPTDLHVAKPKYICEICGKSYIRSWSYYGHIREHAEGVKEHKCYICSKVFSTVGGLKAHLQVHTGQKDYHCTICNKSFSSASSLRNHQITHANEKMFPCKAVGCGKSFGNAASLRIHQRVHQNEKPYPCTHSGCDKAFKTPSELARHEFRHTGEKPFKCDQCDKSFVRNDDLKRHYFIHTGQRRFKCDQCEFSCIQSFDLVKHKYIHGGEKPFKCHLCPKQFTRPARLREHQRLHTGERPYVCEECGKSFSQLTSLKSHKLTHGTQKPYQCEHCDRTFSNTADLQSHVNTHMGVKPYQCTICSKEFVSSKTLKRHAIVHTGEKPFECATCQRKFARASDLKVHEPVHEEDKPYKCNQCTKMFTRYSTLKEHVRLHTGNFPFKCTFCDKEFNHRSHFNVHLRTHTGERPHKCHVCPKEFTRKASLRHHLRTHGITDVGQVIDEENADSSDANTVTNQQMIQLDPANFQLLKSLGGALKRKRFDDDDDASSEETDMVMRKRQMTNYSEQMLSNLVGIESTQEADLAGSVILTQLSSGQYAQLSQSQLLDHNGATVVALNLSDLQHPDSIDNIVQMHSLEGLHGLDTQSLIEQQQHALNQNAHDRAAAATTNAIHLHNQIPIVHTSAESILHSNGQTESIIPDIHIHHDDANT